MPKKLTATAAPVYAHPEPPLSRVEAWFQAQGWQPFTFQREVWRRYLNGESGLLHSATGTGKTQAAWLGPVLEWLQEQGEAPEGAAAPARARKSFRSASPPLRVLWLTPLRALAADTEQALLRPVEALGLPWSIERRTGDVSASVRQRQRSRLPTALITTPESLSLLLSRADAAEQFRDLRAVIVDEWHELLGSKRGAQSELCLARLRGFRPGLRTWGISATLGNLEEARDTLLGTGADGAIVQGAMEKSTVITSLFPATVERFPWAGHMGLRMLPQVVAALEPVKSALVFANTRSQAEGWYHALLEARPNWAGVIAVHHGSLDRKARDWVERALAEGRLKCVVCTSSLDLGVDFSPVELVLQLGSPKGVARLLQRAGRSGHQPGSESRMVCVPSHAFELVEFAAARDAIAQGRIEGRTPERRALDVLAQHAITLAAGPGFEEAALYAEVRRAQSYRDLSREEWSWVLSFITDGGSSLRAYPQYRKVELREGRYQVTDPQVARQHRMTIGTILSDAALQVQVINGSRLGTVEESFAARLKPGDKFYFGGGVVEFVRVREMTVWVRRSSGRGALPRWMGGQMTLSTALGEAVRRKLAEAAAGVYASVEMEAVRPILELQQRWSSLPGENDLLIEQFKTRSGHHLVFYPLEGRAVHEGLAALFAWRLTREAPCSFAFAANDYGFELLSAHEVEVPPRLERLLSTAGLLDDIAGSMNLSEMARRNFRQVARVAGLVFTGFPGAGKSVRQLQASSGLLFDVFQKCDPENLLLQQAYREVLEQQLESSRLTRALTRLGGCTPLYRRLENPSPLSFPLVADPMRARLSSEKFSDRIRRLQAQLERRAGARA